MKNCELNVRTIDEGALDEKSGMNFSEYIAILSGDTRLLEKSKLEKKVAVLESLRSVHYKEMARSRLRLERLENEQCSISRVLVDLIRDEKLYTSRLQYDADGAKLNPLQLYSFTSADPEQIGNYITHLHENWKLDETDAPQKIGSLYGFHCYIRRQQEGYEEDGNFVYRYHNAFYVQHPDGGIKYTYNHGQPTSANPKLAARHFLNALDRVGKITEQFSTQLKDIENDIPVLRTIIAKPFERESELKAMKQELYALEKDIAKGLEEQKISKGESVERVAAVAERQGSYEVKKGIGQSGKISSPADENTEGDMLPKKRKRRRMGMGM